VQDDREYMIDKYLSKFTAAYPNKPQPNRDEVAIYVDKRIRLNKQITYPLVGLVWDQFEWEKQREGK